MSEHSVERDATFDYGRAAERCRTLHDNPSNWQPCYFCCQVELHEITRAITPGELVAQAIERRADTALIGPLEDLAYRDAARIAREFTRDLPPGADQ